jgi:hypothetical protein
MPRVDVVTEVHGSDPETLYSEYVPTDMLADEDYAEQLVERLGWALVDAQHMEEAIGA